MWWKWIGSKAVRQAVELRRHVIKMFRAQQDVLPAAAVANLRTALTRFDERITSHASAADLRAEMERFEGVASQALRPYPQAVMRENVEMILVSLTIVLSIFTFFAQHFTIPSGSMQPTLFGITHEDHRGDAGFQIPGVARRVFERLAYGVSYFHVVARADGPLQALEAPQTLLPFVKRQRLLVGDQWYTIWFPPADLGQMTGWQQGQTFHQGEDILKLKVTAGDHLFVDRLTYNFRHPRRGEIIVFISSGIPLLIQDTYYIKRLIGLSGDHLRIGNDRHVVVNGQRLDASTPHFDKVYNFGPIPLIDHYSGHVNGVVGAQYSRAELAPLFPNETAENIVGPNRYLVMGDNTMNSFDSRAWGDFPRQKVIGKSFLVFWPFTSRLGWGSR